MRNISKKDHHTGRLVELVYGGQLVVVCVLHRYFSGGWFSFFEDCLCVTFCLWSVLQEQEGNVYLFLIRLFINIPLRIQHVYVSDFAGYGTKKQGTHGRDK